MVAEAVQGEFGPRVLSHHVGAVWLSLRVKDHCIWSMSGIHRVPGKVVAEMIRKYITSMEGFWDGDLVSLRGEEK